MNALGREQDIPQPRQSRACSTFAYSAGTWNLSSVEKSSCTHSSHRGRKLDPPRGVNSLESGPETGSASRLLFNSLEPFLQTVSLILHPLERRCIYENTIRDHVGGTCRSDKSAVVHYTLSHTPHIVEKFVKISSYSTLIATR